MDVWVTVDSDTVLAPTALDEVSKPFSDPDVTSVAGLLLGRNRRRNLLTRTIDLEFVQSFIVGRAGPGLIGSVMTTCGALAAYRGDVIRDNLGTYAEQTIMGRPMNNGDDRFLTQAAHLKGKTVFAERAVGYTALPENLSHLMRQRLRWSSSWYWGMSHLLRTAPLHRPALWMALVESWTFVMYTTVLVLVVASGSLPEVLPWWAGYMTMLSYIYGVRYVSLDREDAPLTDRLLTWLVCAPLVSVLYWSCLNPVRYASIFMIRGSNWLTRQKVEVHA